MQTLRGTVRTTPLVELEHPLPDLPTPPDDLTLLWTYPGIVEEGDAVLSPEGDGVWTFETRIPRRFGDLGHTRKGLMANGWWHPVLTDDGPTEWMVTIRLPDHTTGVLNGVIGEDTLSWSGSADRLSLAVVEDAHITELADGVVMLSDRTPPKRVVRELTDLADTAPEPLNGIIVLAPLRRRLARDGVHVTYLSDRAFRMTPPLPPFHRAGVARGLYSGLSGLTDDLARDMVGARGADALGSPSARRSLRWLSWIPTIDFVLYDRTLPFYGDVFTTPTPTDGIRDDVSMRHPHRAGDAAIGQVALIAGEDNADALVQSLYTGRSVEQAALAADVPPELAAGWRRAMPTQDYHLDVDRDVVRVTRTAPPDAPVDVISVRRDGEVLAHLTPEGPTTWDLPRDGARRIRLDPQGLTEQETRLGDSYPRRFRITASGGISQINLTEGWVSAGAGLFLRRRGDNRNTGSLSAATGRDTLVVVGLGYTHRFGPELSGLSRRHRVSLSASTALQNQRFADSDDPPVTTSAGMGWSWSNRQAGLFPLRGWRLSVSTSAGVAPTTDQRWVSARGIATRLIPLHPRLVLASRASLAIADSDVRVRLLSLGGPAAVGGLPFGTAFGTRRATLTTELRAVPLRNLSVPLALLWGTELQVSAGAEVGSIGTPTGPEHGAGLTFGVSGVGDVFGAKPYLLGVTIGVPVWWTDGVDPGTGSQISLRWTQDF